MNEGFPGSGLVGSSVAFVGALAILPSYVEWLVKILAVVGAAAVGALGVGFLVRRLGKWLIFREVPRPVLNLFRALGGIAAGLAIWTMVFSPGGSGLFGGGGSVLGGKGTESQSGIQFTTAPLSKAEPAAPLTNSLPATPVLRIVILGGARVAGQRFYALEGQKNALTLSELKKVIREQHQAGVRNIELLIYQNSVARNHPAVRDLEKWAEQNDLTVSKPPTKGEIPQ
jgi:hypothetical protein